MKHSSPAFAVVVLALAGVATHGQTVSLVSGGVAYTQNFDTLSNATGSTTNTLSLTGWYVTESGFGSRDNELYAVDAGGSTTGDTYSYGAIGSTERALGSLRSGTLVPTFGAAFSNNTGLTITDLAISYTGEQWRLGTAGRTDRLGLQYSLDASSLGTGTWINLDSLDFVTPATTTAGAKDGNAATNRVALSSAVSGLSVADGSTLWLRWIDYDATGGDDGLAVDDFSLTPTVAIPEPSACALTLAGLALGLAVLRRRLSR
jgi:hypothetical protein